MIREIIKIVLRIVTLFLYRYEKIDMKNIEKGKPLIYIF